MTNVEVDLALDSGASINLVGNDLTAEDITRLQTAVDSLNPTNADDIRTELEAARTTEQ